MAGVGVIMILAGFIAERSVNHKVGPGRLLGLVSSARVIYTLGLLFVYAFLLGRLGHILTTVLVMWGLFYDWKRRITLSAFSSQCWSREFRIYFLRNC